MNNALLYGLPEKLIKRLQNIQNAAARIIVGADRYASAKPIISQLHWLRVRQRMDYKIILLTFKALNGLTAIYIRDLITIKTVSRDLRNNKGIQLIEHRSRTSFGDRAFSIAAPKLWNRLPNTIRNITSIDLFKKDLKTHLFKNC